MLFRTTLSTFPLVHTGIWNYSSDEISDWCICAEAFGYEVQQNHPAVIQHHQTVIQNHSLLSGINQMLSGTTQLLNRTTQLLSGTTWGSSVEL